MDTLEYIFGNGLHQSFKNTFHAREVECMHIHVHRKEKLTLCRNNGILMQVAHKESFRRTTQGNNDFKFLCLWVIKMTKKKQKVGNLPESRLKHEKNPIKNPQNYPRKHRSRMLRSRPKRIFDPKYHGKAFQSSLVPVESEVRRGKHDISNNLHQSGAPNEDIVQNHLTQRC